MKEIEVKILNVDANRIRNILKRNKAKLIMPKNKQTNAFFGNKLTKKHGVIRLRKNILGNMLTFKSKLKVVRGHKVMDEYSVKIDNFENAKKGLELAGLKQFGWAEVIRDDWKLEGCLVSIMTFPKIPTYVEIEGSEKNISKVAKLLGYSKKEYYPRSILNKYKLKARDWRFK
jgi:adenylate cyclase class 2